MKRLLFFLNFSVVLISLVWLFASGYQFEPLVVLLSSIISTMTFFNQESSSFFSSSIELIKNSKVYKFRFFDNFCQAAKNG